ncbi:hypothetical protein [Nereida sp. MMG025]|uniref:hypothetical protein n=1 Tax=Nereida sp. MMG025 TaxID=2909981 RepID=UPI001F2AB7CA|nr:hypothetical protein [Nereida sp. MMG025]MCF6446154.1 hypothetical protein [Nereida sp. MMG025]
MEEEEIQERLVDYCALWGIDIATTEANPAAALRILEAMYGVPLIERVHDREQALGRIGESAAEAFPGQNLPFHYAIGQHFYMLAHLPHFYTFIASARNLSAAELIELYQKIQEGITRLKFAAGITGGRPPQVL